MKHGAQYNRLFFCPYCSGRLGGDKSPYVSEQGVAYRTRICRDCGLTVYSKQGPEEITGTEMVAETTHHPGPVLQQQNHELQELNGVLENVPKNPETTSLPLHMSSSAHGLHAVTASHVQQ